MLHQFSTSQSNLLSFKAFKDAIDSEWTEFNANKYKVLARSFTRSRLIDPFDNVEVEQPEILESNQPTEQEYSKQKVIIVTTFMRSGSTFVGELFNLHSEVFYQFEPLHADASVQDFQA